MVQAPVQSYRGRDYCLYLVEENTKIRTIKQLPKITKLDSDKFGGDRRVRRVVRM